MKKTAKVTYDVIRRMAIQLPNVEEGTSYGTPALKVKKSCSSGFEKKATRSS
jgi:hypothetical protein